MTRVAPMVPADTDLLCESCGYTLNGLAEGSNCPECGRPVVESRGLTRHAPAWELRPSQSTFWATTAHVTFRPTHFYRTTTVRGDLGRARTFATIHWIAASLLFAATAHLHTMIFWGSGMRTTFFDLVVSGAGFVGLILAVFIALGGTTLLASKLTAWEAAYRGYRLPTPVVRRGLYYHAAHYLPVALIALLTVVGYRVLLAGGVLDLSTAATYLYVLCGEVIVGAAYLFHTYWIGMKSMMYANR